jgi:hypothetical protein
MSRLTMINPQYQNSGSSSHYSITPKSSLWSPDGFRTLCFNSRQEKESKKSRVTPFLDKRHPKKHIQLLLALHWLELKNIAISKCRGS